MDAPFPQVVDLIFHQGNKWCDDNAHPLFRQCRNLESDALSAACRHQSQCVVTATDAFDDFTLDATEIVVAPIALKY